MISEFIIVVTYIPCTKTEADNTEKYASPIRFMSPTSAPVYNHF